ncbi:hypothetical protein Bbelb_400150 [Branchiostoma belcheri]|nr:hypothetical protein Bbelb_400150 [Branchiostoma belcheri]
MPEGFSLQTKPVREWGFPGAIRDQQQIHGRATRGREIENVRLGDGDETDCSRGTDTVYASPQDMTSGSAVACAAYPERLIMTTGAQLCTLTPQVDWSASSQMKDVECAIINFSPSVDGFEMERNGFIVV